MNDTFLPGSGFDTYESQDKVLMQMDGSTEAAVAVRILQQQGFAVVGAVVRLAPEQAEAAQRAKKAAEALLLTCCMCVNLQSLPHILLLLASVKIPQNTFSYQMLLSLQM